MRDRRSLTAGPVPPGGANAEARVRSMEPFVLVLGGGSLLCLAASLIPSSRAWASLGGRPDSVAVDRAHLSAKLRSEAVTGRVVHVLTLANGAERREFARSDGMIYAITWQGRARPDLRQLMGPWFAAYNAQLAEPGAHRERRRVDVRRADLVVHGAGHMGAFWGYAYLPQLAPADFSVTDLKPTLTP